MKWLKKKTTLGSTSYGDRNMELEELKDMDLIQEDAIDEDQPE